MKVAFHTLGCKVNHYESSAMEKLFAQRGYEIVRDGEEADIYVINTCTVTNLSDRKSRQFIRRAKNKDKNSVLLVVGCYSQVSPEDLMKLDEVDVIIGTRDRANIVDLTEEFLKDRKKINTVRLLDKDLKFEEIDIENIEEKTRAYIKIQDGCNMFCSYCIIPYARGPIRSRSSNEVIEEVKRLGKRGFKEIVLTGIHLASYGLDSQADSSLIDLINEIKKIDSIERIRFSSIEPRLITEKFMEELVKGGKVCDHFHLSLQSGSNKTLKKMNRKYDRYDYKKSVDIIRKYYEKAGITTDIIVGFPGESDNDFEESLEFAKEIGFSRIHVFKYSKRDGTPAAKMDDQVDGNIKNARSKELIELGEKLEEEFLDSLIGEEVSVLFEEESKDGNYIEGYSSNYVRVKIDKDISLINEIRDVEIIKKIDNFLYGKIKERR